MFLISRAECVDESGNSTRQSVAMAGHPGAWPAAGEKSQNGEKAIGQNQNKYFVIPTPKIREDKDRKTLYCKIFMCQKNIVAAILSF